MHIHPFNPKIITVELAVESVNPVIYTNRLQISGLTDRVAELLFGLEKK